MKRRLTAFLICTVLQFTLISVVNAQTQHKDDNYDYLKIFIPHHTVKSVSAIFTDEIGQAKTINTLNQRSQLKSLFTQEDLELLAKVVYAESKGEPFIGKIGVASVILNRLYHPHFPKSINGIIYQKNAFSCLNEIYKDIEPDKETYEAVDEALNGYDPTDNAVFFYNPNTASSKWIKNAPKDSIVKIGNHIFFR